MSNACGRRRTSGDRRAMPRGPRRRAVGIARIVALSVAWLAGLGCSPAPQRSQGCLGPWAVGYRRAMAVDRARGGRALPLAIWYPVAPDEARGRRASYACFEHPLLTLSIRSDPAVADAPISRAQQWPLIVFSHGAPSLETQSPDYVETLASWGFVVVAVRHVGSTIFDKRRAALPPASGASAAANGAALDAPRTIAAARRGERWALDLASKPALFSLNRPFDVWFAIDWVAEQARDPSSFLHGAVDAARVGVTGHSAGGCTTLVAAAGYGGEPPDPRIKAIVAIATAATAIISEETLRSITAPALFVAGDRDERTPWETETRRAAERVASRPAAIVKIHGAGHTHFADIDGFARRLRSQGIYPWMWRWVGAGLLAGAYAESHREGTLPPSAVQRILDKYAVAFFRLHLKGDRGASALLDPARARSAEPLVEFLTPPFAPSGRLTEKSKNDQ